MKSTKKSLLLSALSLLLCVSMLVGTTFAWFTDSVTSGKNIIKAGNLDIEMYYADGTQDPATVSWTDAADETIFNYTLWEPGYTQVSHIKIANVGTLALKYELAIIADGDLGKLAEVLDVYASVGEATQAATRADLADTDKFAKLGTLDQVLTSGTLDLTGNLMPSGTTGKTSQNTLTIAVKMQEEAGNEYQNLAIGSGFTVAVKATQYTYEKDSFDDKYDEGAEYPVVSSEEFAEALEEAEAGDTILLSDGVEVSTPAQNYVVAEGVSIKGGEGAVLKVEGDNALNLKNDNITISDLTIKGENVGSWEYNSIVDITGDNVTLDNVNITSTSRTAPIKVGAIASADNSIVIKDSTIEASFKAIHIVDGSKGTITIDNCNITAVYPFNVNTTSNPEVIVKDSTLNGWTSYSSTTKKVTFTNCSFGNGKSYAVLMAHADTELVNCNFSSDFEVYTNNTLSGKSITFTNCTKGGTAITAANVKTIFDTTDSDSLVNTTWTLTVDGAVVG